MIAVPVKYSRESVDSIFNEHLKKIDQSLLQEKSHQYIRDGYTNVTELIPRQIINQMEYEGKKLLEEYSIRRDIKIEQTENSPRKMSNVSQKEIAEFGQIIPEVYESKSLMNLLGRLAQDTLIPCPWEDEKYIITKQERVGDTHGWHWGDYSHTLIWVVEAPPLDFGGMLQCVPHTTWNKDKANVNHYLVNNSIKSYYHPSGSVYFLKSDTTLHRTVPLSQKGTRIIVNTCWGSIKDKHKIVDHGTMLEGFV